MTQATMSAKHTPGPWTINPATLEFSALIEINGGGDHIASVTVNTKRGKKEITPEQDANGRLIAAAPELLEALRRLLIEMGEGTARGRAIDLLPRDTVAFAQAALAKAQ